MFSPRSFLVTRQNQLHSRTANVSRGPSPSRVPPSPSSSPSSPSSLSSSPPISQSKDDYQVRAAAEDLTNAIGFAMPSRRNSGGDAAVASPTPMLSPAKPTTALTRPTTPTSPVQIPVKQKHHQTSHMQKQRRVHADSRRPRLSSNHDANSISPSVANLLAVTSIPPLKGTRSLKSRNSPFDKRMTVESIIEHTHDTEKEFSLSLGGSDESRSPLQVLLGPPDEFDSDAVSISEGTMGSPFSIRTISVESMPSLAESFATGTISPGDSPLTPVRGRKLRPTRRTMTPVSSPPGEREQHPLSVPDVDELDFRVFEAKPESQEKEPEPRSAIRPLRSAFKSNLTASLRALRNAAKSFSNMNLTSIPPEDFLTRSLLTLDPRIPYTDERRPPPLEQEPSAELRRYLNPTTTTHVASPTSPAHLPTRTTFTASIQMQTYKVHRSRGSHSPTRPQAPTSPFTTAPTSQPAEHPLPGPRQRELRENSDFIRIAVMEMAMRRKGKLDDRKPGRARLALPPRRTSAKPYEIGVDGIPARWVAVTG